MKQKKQNPTQSYFLAGWEKELEQHNLTSNGMEKVYVCSPLGADTVEKICQNMHYAREYMYYATQLFDCVAVAPHAYLPVLLNDTIADERNLGLKFGVELLGVCQHIFVCGSVISTGMAAEIKYAAREGIKIHIFNESIKEAVEKLCEGTRANVSCHFGGEFVPLSVFSPRTYFVDKDTFLRKLFK